MATGAFGGGEADEALGARLAKRSWRGSSISMAIVVTPGLGRGILRA
jgi:hypothetical protein